MAAAKSSPYQQGYQKGWLDAWRGVFCEERFCHGDVYYDAYLQARRDFHDSNLPQAPDIKAKRKN